MTGWDVAGWALAISLILGVMISLFGIFVATKLWKRFWRVMADDDEFERRVEDQIASGGRLSRRKP